MNTIIINRPAILVLIVTGLLAGAQTVSAGADAECRKEAEDYGIMPELRDEYISGCIESRGGVSVSVSAEEDYVPPSESDDEINREGGDQNPAE